MDQKAKTQWTINLVILIGSILYGIGGLFIPSWLGFLALLGVDIWALSRKWMPMKLRIRLIIIVVFLFLYTFAGGFLNTQAFQDGFGQGDVLVIMVILLFVIASMVGGVVFGLLHKWLFDQLFQGSVETNIQSQGEKEKHLRGKRMGIVYIFVVVTALFIWSLYSVFGIVWPILIFLYVIFLIFSIVRFVLTYRHRA